MKLLLLGASILLSVGLQAEPVLSAERLHSMAREARTANQHARVSKHYRLRAEALEAEAAKHEATAAEYTRSLGPMRHKWPAMAPRALHEAKRKAVEARQAARESRALAGRHLRLAVEAQAD
jgi:hypothetical protein